MAAGVCPCDADVDQSMGATIQFQDIAAVVDCANGISCANCAIDCDVNCDGTVDHLDTGAVVCHFEAGTTSGEECCDEPAGACVGATQGLPPDCTVTTEAACDLFSGTYKGDDTSCTACCSPGQTCTCESALTREECDNLGGIFHQDYTCSQVCGDGNCVPATSEWGLALLVLLVLITGTMLLRRRMAMNAA
jgi:hypothetical protein